MRVHKIANCEDSLYNEFIELYGTSFPIFEQRTEAQQRSAFEDERYNLETYIEDDKFIGFISYWEFDSYIYIEHLAINSSLRGEGYGSRLLREFAQRSGKMLLLEIDPIVDEISAKRLRFYEHNGFVANIHTHRHPPYRESFEGHQLIVLTTEREINKAEYEQFSSDLKEVVMAW